MKKSISVLIVAVLVLSLCAACGGKTESEAAPAAAEPAAPVVQADPAVPAEPAAGVAGTYTFNETNVNGLEISWTLELNTDGTYKLSEDNAFTDTMSYTGNNYTANGNVVNCGPMNESGPAFYVWADPAGFTVTLNADGTFTPDQEGKEPTMNGELPEGLLAASGEASGEASN